MKKIFILYPLSLILLSACGRESEVRKEARLSMVAGCIAELGVIEAMIDPERLAAFCECAVARIIKNYTDAELVEMGRNPEAFEDRSNQDAVQAIAKCQDKLIPTDF